MSYRRITYGFVHADTAHLLANIGGQLIFALLICLDVEEKSWIRMAKAFAVYIVSIFGGSIAFDYVPNKEICGLVGASAGVFGLCGMLAAEAIVCILSTLARSPFSRNLIDYNNQVWKVVLACMKLFLSLTLIGIDLYYNFSLSSKEKNDGATHKIDTLYVHMGGLISGILLIILLEAVNCIFNCRKTNEQLH